MSLLAFLIGALIVAWFAWEAIKGVAPQLAETMDPSVNWGKGDGGFMRDMKEYNEAAGNAPTDVTSYLQYSVSSALVSAGILYGVGMLVMAPNIWTQGAAYSIGAIRPECNPICDIVRSSNQSLGMTILTSTVVQTATKLVLAAALMSSVQVQILEEGDNGYG